MKAFVVDLGKCNGCYACQLACKDETVGNEWPPYSKPQPDTGQFWLKMFEKTHGQVPKVRVEYRPQPVSYTHLDVYKRQARRSPAPSRTRPSRAWAWKWARRPSPS